MEEETSISLPSSVRERVNKFACLNGEAYSSILGRIMDIAEDFQTITRLVLSDDIEYVYICASDKGSTAIDIKVMKKANIEIEPMTVTISLGGGD